MKQAKNKLLELFDDLVSHDGFGEIKVDIKILKRGQKEVIIHCGKQYRYVIDFKKQEQGEKGENNPTDPVGTARAEA